MGRKLVIVGGVAGGATAAGRARRLDEHAEIVLLERGEHISFANCGLPYYVGDVIKDREDLLVTNPKAFGMRYNLDIRVFSEVTAIDRSNKQVVVKDLATGEVYREGYDTLILSPGAESLRPAIDGVDLDTVFNLRTIPDSERIKTMVDSRKPESAVVVGGGYIGLEMVENLVVRGVRTAVVEKVNQVMPVLDFEMAALVHARVKEQGVELHLRSAAQSISRRGGRTVVTTDDGVELECDLVVLAIGVRPKDTLAREAGLDIGVTGGIKVDATMKTSDPYIYAVGDAVEVRDFVTGLPVVTALAGPANKQGRIAADNALGRKSVFRGTLGTSIVRVFDTTVASTGPSEKVLKRHKIPSAVSYTHSGSHASYYPGAEAMSIKLIFAPSSGRILGAQIVGGREGVDKRIDVLATAIRAGMSVYDLEELELAYAPPFSSAKDPVNIAGYVASNMLKGDVTNTYWDEMADLKEKGVVLIDLRNADELEASGTIPGSLHIPLSDLRQRLAELEEDRQFVVFCAAGHRAYIAHRILTQRGYDSHNLSGGYKTYLGAKETIMEEPLETQLWLSE